MVIKVRRWFMCVCVLRSFEHTNARPLNFAARQFIKAQ
jgi:hypothetical protein